MFVICQACFTSLNRRHGSGSVMVTSPASRSKTAGRIKRVAVGADDHLFVDCLDVAAVAELANAAGKFDGGAKIHIGFRAFRIFHRDGHRRLGEGGAWAESGESK